MRVSFFENTFSPLQAEGATTLMEQEIKDDYPEVKPVFVEAQTGETTGNTWNDVNKLGRWKSEYGRHIGNS